MQQPVILNVLQVRVSLLLIKQKRLRWSRSLRYEALNNFKAKRDSLRALFDEIELKKAELRLAKAEVYKSKKAVSTHRSDLRKACIDNKIPDLSHFTKEADSSDEEYGTDASYAKSDNEET